MWARRCGCPPLWPSRVKVFFLGIFGSAFIYSVFQYLASASVDYLDFESPARMDIDCKLPGPGCTEALDPIECMRGDYSTRWWAGVHLEDGCPAWPSSIRGQTCRNVRLPLSSLTGDLARLHTINSNMNPFTLWSILFLVLTSLLGTSILIHDLALLQEVSRRKILDFPSLRKEVLNARLAPRSILCFKRFFASIQCRHHMQRLWARSRVVWVLLVLPWAVFQAVAFMVVAYPFALVVCCRHPIQMSRIMVFLSGTYVMLWSLVFIIVAGFLDARMYAVLWGEAVPGRTSCICLCEFPLNRHVFVRIVILGVGVFAQSFALTFRALRGLRRQQWANLFSVLYAVPIEAFPVVWERPDGGPIRFRSEGEPVQGEPAFDPFCLMDEQPESARTRALLQPGQQTPEQQERWRHQELRGESADTDIGCCGFPLAPLRRDVDDEKMPAVSPNGAYGRGVVGNIMLDLESIIGGEEASVGTMGRPEVRTHMGSSCIPESPDAISGTKAGALTKDDSADDSDLVETGPGARAIITEDQALEDDLDAALEYREYKAMSEPEDAGLELPPVCAPGPLAPDASPPPPRTPHSPPPPPPPIGEAGVSSAIPPPAVLGATCLE